ncbi:MAG: ABC transporter ATP-binding protein [Desulfobacterales bacterium]|nr:ABC transporter ATP-binding protein [Desulfobacterales bacterium]
MISVSIRDLKKTFYVKGTEIKALNGFTSDIENGETVSIVGHSGCGKTTLLRIISGLEKPDEGQVLFIDENKNYTKPKRIGMVFQEPRLLPWLTVEKNIMLALKHIEHSLSIKEIVNNTLKVLGIYNFRDAYPHQLSGGMAQRASLGRALCRQPDLLLMDEPLGSLDALTRHRLRHELIDILAKSNITTILVTHDVTEAILLGNKIIIVESGRIVQEIKVPMQHPRDENSIDFIRIKNTLLKYIFK